MIRHCYILSWFHHRYYTKQGLETRPSSTSYRMSSFFGRKIIVDFCVSKWPPTVSFTYAFLLYLQF